jgi:hypothetical protein
MKANGFLLAALWLLSCGPGAFAVQMDGTISEGEYHSQLSFADGIFTLYWSLEGQTAYFGLRALTEGWVAVGFDPVRAMDQADMIFGWVLEDGTVGALDAFSTGLYGPHPIDEELGGSRDILAFAGSQSAGLTVFEFSRPLDTGDRFDRPLRPEAETRIILAFAHSDDRRDLHSYRGGAAVRFAGPAPLQADNGPRADLYSLLYPVHAVLMSAAFVLLFAGMFLPRYFKSKKWWLRTHRWTGISGSALGVAGVGLAVYMIFRTTGIHLRVAHSWFGLVTILFLIHTPLLGHFMLKIRKAPDRARRTRAVHRWTGRGTIVLMAATIGLGLWQVWGLLF